MYDLVKKLIKVLNCKSQTRFLWWWISLKGWLFQLKVDLIFFFLIIWWSLYTHVWKEDLGASRVVFCFFPHLASQKFRPYPPITAYRFYNLMTALSIMKTKKSNFSSGCGRLQPVFFHSDSVKLQVSVFRENHFEMHHCHN